MPSLQLKAEPLLGGFQVTFDDTTLAEVDNISIVSIAIPLDGRDVLASAIERAFGADIPAPGESTLSKDGRTRFLWTMQDQIFALFEEENPHAANDVAKKLNGAGYVTLQSDNWVALRLAGNKACDALERICPLDLHPSAFPEGRAARTVMDHMGTLVLREGSDTFLLLSASSSARSFLHTVETSLHNVT